MTDPYDDQARPPAEDAATDDGTSLTPAQETALRRLLRDARHTEPAPAAVAARLDDVIAGLARERAAGTTAGDPPPYATTGQAGQPGQPGLPDRPAPAQRSEPSASTSTPLDLDAARRRRGRRVNVLLGAAAAVVVIGVGGVLVPQWGGSDSNESSSDAGSAEMYDSESSDGGGAGMSEVPPGEAPTDLPGAPMTPLEPGAQREAVRTLAALAPDPGELLAAPADVGLAPELTTGDLSAVLRGAASSAGRALPASTCGGVGADEGGVLTTYDGAPALLVVRVDGGDDPTRVTLSVRDCGSGAELRSTTVPGR